MSKLKTYDVVVTTTDQWSGTVEALSRSAARRLAQTEFDEGRLRQTGEEIEKIAASEVRS